MNRLQDIWHNNISNGVQTKTIMISRNDPRVRRAIDQITQGFESANERTQENIFTFTQTYIKPCLSAIGEHTRSCTAVCCGDEERRRRNRRGQAESSFDFYDDWEAEETDALLGLSSESSERPGLQRRRQMSYGTTIPHVEGDTKNIHSSSYFGFLERFPFRLGAKGFTYKPSIADLQDHPTRKSPEPEETAEASQSNKRKRSGTFSSGHSGHTTDSFSSRGDIFPSEDEMDDAVPIDDEFAWHLERRVHGMEDSGTLSRDGASTHSLPNIKRKRPVKSHSSSSQDVRQAGRESIKRSNSAQNVLEPHSSSQNEQIVDSPLNLSTENISKSVSANSFNAAALPRFSSN